MKETLKDILKGGAGLILLMGPPAVAMFVGGYIGSQRLRRTEEMVDSAFTQYDTNRDNVLNRQELNDYLLNDYLRSPLLKAVDENLDGDIDKKELRSLFFDLDYPR